MRIHKSNALLFTRLLLVHIALSCFAIGGRASAQMEAAAQQSTIGAALITSEQSLTIKGQAYYSGIPLDWTLVINSDGRATSQSGNETYNILTGYDGTSVWRIENGAGPFNIDFAEREVWIMTLLLLSGRESTAKLPADVGMPAGEYFRLSDGELLFHSDQSGKLVAVNSPNNEGIIFTGGNVEGQVGLPKIIQIQNIGEFSEYRISSVKIGPAMDSSHFSRPERITEGFRFLPGTGAELEVTQSDSGHLFVRPLVNGKDLGWFLFDTAAGFSGLSAKAAQELGFKETGGRAWLGGVGNPGGLVTQYRGGPLQLGPLQVDNLIFLDVGEMRKMGGDMSGKPIAGVLGWDIMSRAIVEYDLRDGKLFLHDPKKYRIPEADRRRLYLHWKVPYAIGRFAGDHEGPFMLDTGAGNLGVIFTSYSVERYGLLRGRGKPEGPGMMNHRQGGGTPEDPDAPDGHGPGAGMSMIMGDIDWFEIGGYRKAPAPAMFHMGDDNEADIFTVGILGGGVVTPFRIVLDYGRSEVGFVLRDQFLKEAAATAVRFRTGVFDIGHIFAADLNGCP